MSTKGLKTFIEKLRMILKGKNLYYPKSKDEEGSMSVVVMVYKGLFCFVSF